MKIEILSIAAMSGGAEVSLSVRISDGENSEKRSIVLLSRQFAELRAERGEIGEERFEELEAAALVCSAVKRGMNILGFGACSEKNMRLKLRSKGFDPDTAAEAAAYLVTLGYINESGDAEREAERCVAKLWGRRRIAAALYEKGYSESAVRGAMELLDRVDFDEQCATLIRKKFSGVPDEPRERQKLFAALARYGYSPSEIKNAFRDFD